MDLPDFAVCVATVRGGGRLRADSLPMEALMTRKLRRTCFAASGWLWLTATALSFGCQDSTIHVVPVDLGSGTQHDLTGAAELAYFRLGHFVVGAGPFDVCVKGADDTDFRGPLVHLQTMRPGGVLYASVSEYVSVAPTAYSVR